MTKIAKVKTTNKNVGSFLIILLNKFDDYLITYYLDQLARINIKNIANAKNYFLTSTI